MLTEAKKKKTFLWLYRCMVLPKPNFSYDGRSYLLHANEVKRSLAGSNERGTIVFDILL